MSRTYLRYVSAHSGGVLLSPGCEAIQTVEMENIMPDRFPPQSKPTKAFLTAGARRMQFTAIDSGELLHVVHVAQEGDVKDMGHITTFHFSAEPSMLYVGMSTGRVSMFQYEPEEEAFVEHGSVIAHRFNTKIGVICTNDGHRAPESEYESTRSLMATAGQDTTIVVWDVFAKEPMARLEGHKGPILNLHFLHGKDHARDYLLSVGEDGLMKVWDIAEDYCMKTICVSETSSFLTASAYCAALGIVLVAARDNFLRAYSVNVDNTSGESFGEDEPGTISDILTPLQDIPRRESRLIQKICVTAWSDKKDSMTYSFLCVTKDRLVEVFSRVENPKSRKKATRKRASDSTDSRSPSGIFYTGVLHASTSRIACATVLQVGARAKQSSLSLALGLRNNTIQILKGFPSELAITKAKDKPTGKGSPFTALHTGHSGEITFIALNSTGTAVFTASPVDGIRRWHFTDRHGVARIENNAFIACPNITAVVRIPDDLHVMCATTAGELVRVNVMSMEVEETALVDKQLGGKAKAIAMCASGHQATASYTVYTANADEKVRAYTLGTPFHLPAEPTRTLDIPDVPTCIACCPNDKLLAVGLNDTSIRLYFVDSFRQYLKLYGHAYPPLSVSISSDATLLVSGGMDKSVKIWGMDFGDIHRSIKAHEDYVTEVRCIPGTHYIASVSKDGTAKLWDGDHWDLIQELWRDTSSPVSALCVANDGRCVITGDADGWVKAFERTNDTLFLQDELERRMEREVDKEVEERAMFETRKKLSREVTSRTVSAVAAADALRERIDRMMHDKVHAQQDEAPEQARERHLRLWRFLSEELRSVDFYHALASLSLDIACTILKYLDGLLVKHSIDDVERCAHVVSVLGRIHHRNLPNGLLGDLARKIREMAVEEQSRVGHNLAGLRIIRSQQKEKHVEIV
ncbi:WD repeat-containing protein [Perkinsela sp. CCAP 1560/4]|nr:WD repeat-containing protein [Perkinsela sp. CCAP 1560/4]|eukprot:KNH05437.1 WD repeat-containing protein [Perkinsela sp. CCAP 1560/4]